MVSPELRVELRRLHTVEGASVNELAARFGLPRKTVVYQLCRARARPAAAPPLTNVRDVCPECGHLVFRPANAGRFAWKCWGCQVEELKAEHTSCQVDFD